MAPPEQGSQHHEPYDPSTNLDVQEFHEWLDSSRCDGVIFAPNRYQPTKFLPDQAIEDYFDWKPVINRAKIKKLVAAATVGSSMPVDARAVTQRCPKVFTILVMIGQSKYINSFVTKDDLLDRRLPFRPEARSLFPRLPNDASFFDEFCQKQWQFCVEPLRYGLEHLILNNVRILPIIDLKKLDKQQGASAVVHRIRVHPEYDDLAEHLQPGQGYQNDSHEYVIKSYYSVEAEKYFHAEVEAFQKLNGAGEPVPNLIGFYGAFKQNDSFHVILEYANGGTLEDYFKEVQSPKEGDDILRFWENFFQVNHALVRIHTPGDSHVRSSSRQPRIFQGWHQDIKPANILVAGDLENDPYGARFMLADLGLSHFKAVLDDGYDVTGEDTHGARAYRAPECNLAQSPVSNFAARVKQCIDTWSLACVYSEANAWIVDGWKHGVLKYRTERQQEANNPNGACFHNDKGNLLDKVRRWHTEIMPKRCATEDHVTGVMWDELLQYMFSQQKSRIDAQQVVAYSEHVINKAQAKLRPAPLRTQTAPAAAETPVREDERPRTPPNVPPEVEYNDLHSRNPPQYPMTPPYDHNSRQPPVSALDSSRVLSHSPDSLVNDNMMTETRGNRESLNSGMSEEYDHTRSSGSHTNASAAHLGASQETIVADEKRMSQADSGPGLRSNAYGNGYDEFLDEIGPPIRRSTMPPRAGQRLSPGSAGAPSSLTKEMSVLTLHENANAKGKSVHRAGSTKQRRERSMKILTVNELRHWAE